VDHVSDRAQPHDEQASDALRHLSQITVKSSTA
jgi:hypothetical protein